MIFKTQYVIWLEKKYPQMPPSLYEQVKKNKSFFLNGDKTSSLLDL